MVTEVTLPRRRRGRQSAAAEAAYQAHRAAFCEAILEISSRLDFRVSARGWAYILEEYGLGKGDFDAAEKVINQCRKDGDLPLDICAEDDARLADHLQRVDRCTPHDEAHWIVRSIGSAHLRYTPQAFWYDQEYYVELWVEKIDLKNLFAPVCGRWYVPLTNARGWSCINSRAAVMKRFAKWEARGKRCVLLFCGDHDPGGLSISQFLRSNMADLSQAVGWSPENLIIDRFGLNADFIEANRLTWIDNLETASGGRLDDPRHPDHNKAYVRDYLHRFGPRKVEANALVVRPDAGRDLCERAIREYVSESALDAYHDHLRSAREEVREEVVRLLREAQT